MKQQIIDGVMFEWDTKKEDLVLKNHQVTFSECASVLLNDLTITKEDFRDYGEVRFVSVGYSNKARILTVVWTDRGDKIRLITGFKSSDKQIKEFNRGQRF